MNLFDILKDFDGSKFPDLEKAKNAVSLDTLVKPGEPTAKIAQDEQAKLERQLAVDFCSFQLSLGTATARGGENSCADKHNFETIDTQFGNWQQANTPQTHQRHPIRPYTAVKKLPKPVSVAPGGDSPRSLSKTRINNGATSSKAQPYYVPVLKPSPNKAKQERQAEQFVKAQAGQRGTAVGDAALVFGANGQPYPGDSYLDRSIQQNESANLASSTSPVIEPPKLVAPRVVGGGGMDRASNGQIAPQSNTVGNLAVLGGIALTITGLMLAIGYVVQIVSFIFNIQNLLNTCTNIGASFSGLINTIGSLVGLGENVSKPLDETIGGILNSVFGRDKTDYVKFQWSKISAALSAAGNVLNGFRSVSNTLGNAVEIGTNNTGKIGNALRAMGFLDRTVGTFDEKVSATIPTSKLAQANNSLQVADQAGSSLAQATADIKSGQEQLAQIDKDFEEKKAERDKDKTTTERAIISEPIPTTPNFKPGDY